MAGGKETPRQKMIGMMYLVLTALLALNVSKQILDAFVAIEENIQRGSITQVERGDAARSAMEEEIKSTNKDASGLAKIAKIKKYLGKIDDIDKEAIKLIRYIDEIKFDLLNEAKENTTTIKNEEREVIVWKDFDPKHPLQPKRLNLAAVEAKDQFDIPMQLIIGSDINNLDPELHGLKLWKAYNNFRKYIVETTGTYKENEKTSWKVKVGNVNDDISNELLEKKIKAEINKKSNKVNPEDAEVLLGLYQELTKVEFAPHGEDSKDKNAKRIHWMGRTFDHAPMVGALASLSSMQNEILSARAKAVNLLKSKVTVGEFSFNKIQQLVSGPGVATEGDDIELKVTMAAYDSDNNPEVTGSGSITVKDGIGTVKTRASGSGEMNLNGTVMIRNKSGVEYRKPWSWKVILAKPQGSISSPELNVVYEEYPNVIVPSAAGYVKTILKADGQQMNLTPRNIEGQSYLAGVYSTKRSSGFVTFTVTGVTGTKQKLLSTIKYRVMPFPEAKVTTPSLKKGTGGIAVVALPQGVPLKADYNTVKWLLTDGTTIQQGQGKVVTNGPVLQKAKIGQKLILSVTYQRIGSNKQQTTAKEVVVN